MSPDIDLNQSLKRLAERHRGRGIFNEDYDRIGFSIIHSMREFGVMNEETVNAWNIAWDLFANAMKLDGNSDQNFKVVVDDYVEDDDISILRKIKMEEFHEHNKPNDIWLLINGKIYDVTEFVSIHPGGDKIFLALGKDSSKFFNSLHSIHAKTIMKQYLIGVLDRD